MRAILLFILIIFNAYSNSKFEYLEFSYSIKEKDTFSRIMKRFFKSYKKIDIQNIILKNPHINNWKKLKPNQNITLFIREDLAKLDQIADSMENNKKNYLEKEIEKNITDTQSYGYWKLFFSNQEVSGTEVLPESIESEVDTKISLGVENVFYFNNDLYPLRINTHIQYYSYQDISLISQTNPSTTYTEVSLPSTWGYSLKLTKENLWHNLGLNMMVERNILYNPEFQTALDRNIIRENKLTWFDFGGEYPIEFQKLKINLSASWGLPMLIETQLLDPIGNETFTESDSDLDLSGSRQIFSGEVFYKKYFFNLMLTTTRFSEGKTITFSSIQSIIGIKY